MVLKLAGRADVPPFIVMDLLQRAAERQAAGLPVWHLGAGQPSEGVPAAVTAGVQKFLEEDPQGYTVSLGLPELRRRIAESYRTTCGLDVDPQQVVVTTGSSGAFQLAFTACFEAGDRVGIAVPGYPAYPNILRALGIEPVLLPVGPESRYQPSIDILESLDQPLDGLILACPSNPTGTVLPAGQMKELCDWCEANGVRLISDEIYHGITYGQPAVTALHFSSSAVIINSFSKYYCMTGWRLGWMVVPPELVRPLECLAQNLFISTPTASQYAGILVLDQQEELDRRVQGYARNRDLLLKALPEMGITRFAPPDGAFYLYADFSDYTDDSLAFCFRMLEECGVIVTPGTDFDPLEGRFWLRFSFARDHRHVAGAVAALKVWLAAQPRKSMARKSMARTADLLTADLLPGEAHAAAGA